MKEFLKKILLFFILLCTGILIVSIYLYRIGGNDLPAPEFSNSISFNEKIDFIRDRDLSQIRCIALGSSMTLNNIDSKIMKKYIGDSFLNLGSWGFKISDSERFLNEMTEQLPNLNTVVISTSFMDFSDEIRNIEVDYSMIRFFLKYKSDIAMYLYAGDLKYLFENAKSNLLIKQNINSYRNLDFDSLGGAVLEIDDDHIDMTRWNKNITDFNVSEKELSSLRNLIDFLAARNIRTAVSVPPQRSGLTDVHNLEQIKRTLIIMQSVVEESGGIFINSFEYGSWSDSLFVDYAHLNRTGAAQYSEIIAKKLSFQP